MVISVGWMCVLEYYWLHADNAGDAGREYRQETRLSFIRVFFPESRLLGVHKGEYRDLFKFVETSGID